MKGRIEWHCKECGGKFSQSACVEQRVIAACPDDPHWILYARSCKNHAHARKIE